MDDDNGLELSLGLSFGGSSSKSKGKDISPGPVVIEETVNKVVNRTSSGSDSSFKNFFQANSENQDHNDKIIVSQPKENFWTDLGKSSATTADVPDTAQSSQSPLIQYQLWSANKRTSEPEDESSNKKRCFQSDEISFQRRRESVTDHAEAVGKDHTGNISVKNSHISINTDDGSTGENEDVAESETEGSNSWLVSQQEERAKQSDASKITDRQAIDDPSVIGIQGKKQQNFTGKEFNSEPGKVTHGVPLSLQPMPAVTAPHPVPAKVVTAPSAPSAACFPPAIRGQVMAASNGEQVQEMNPNSIQIAFGYSSYQLPTLETNSSWAFGSHLRRSSSFSDSVVSQPFLEDDPKRSHVNATSALAFQGKPPDPEKANGKQIAETGVTSTSHGDANRGTCSIFRPKVAVKPPVSENFTPEGSVIRPGIAPDVKFGGCGSYPNLPWVSTTGSGPNGRTISGVTYKYGQNQIKIVCACHGTHMSSEEFIQHANYDATHSENDTNHASAGNPAAPVQN